MGKGMDRAARARGRARVAAILVLVVAGHGVGTLAGALTSEGRVATVAGRGVAGYAGDGSPAVAALLHSPSGLAVAGDALVVVDGGNHAVRRITAAGTIEAVAGVGAAGFEGDGGPATAARLQDPRAIARRPNGELFVADTGNHVVRRIIPDGTITTVAGTGTAGSTPDGIPAHASRLASPSGVAVRPSGLVLIADTGNHRLREVTGDGQITTVAGTGVSGFGGDGGQAVDALFNGPTGIAVLPNGTTYVADTGNHRIRRIDVHGTVTTVAGTGAAGWSGDGGPATAAALDAPTGVSVTVDGSLLIADMGNHVVRRIAPTGTITTLMGTGMAGDDGDGGVPTASRLTGPRQAIEGAGGELYVADTGNHRVRTVVPPPDAPAVTQITPIGPANDNRPAVRGHAEPGATVRIHADADCAGQALASGSASDFATGGLVVPVADDTEVRLHAVAVDAHGQASACSVSSVSYIEDSTAPSAPVITSRPPSPAPTRTVTWDFTSAAPATTCSLRDGAGAVVATSDQCRSPWSVSLAGRADATYTIRILARDEAGNTSTPATAAHVLDTTPPPAPSLELVPPPLGLESRPQWRFTAEAGATTSCRLSGPGHQADIWAPCTSPWSPELADDDAAGPWSLEVRATDRAGNTGPTRSLTYTAPSPAGGSDPETQSQPAPAPTVMPDPVAPSTSGSPPVETNRARPPRTPTDGDLVSDTAARATSRRPAPVERSSSSAPTPVELALAPEPAPTRSGLAALAAAAGRLLVTRSDDAAFPLGLILLVLGFLSVQDRLDRRDPKLAQAPVNEPALDFPDRPRPVSRPLPRPWVASHHHWGNP